MPWGQGGDYERDVSRDCIVVKADRRVCQHDNGTTICGLGHKLKSAGKCLGQGAGTFYSTDVTFQPGYPVCTSDYDASGFNEGLVHSRALLEGDHLLFQTSPFVVSIDHPLMQYSNQMQAVYSVFKASISKEGSTFTQAVASQVLKTYFVQAVPAGASAFWRMAQFNPGDLPHWPDVFSDLFVYDVYSSFVVINRLVIHMLEMLAASYYQRGDIEITGNVVQTDYYTTITEEGDICVGDYTPPYITLHSPTVSGIKVRPRDQVVDFSLSDPVGGVDISSVYVGLNSATTSGSISLIEAGVDQTGGDLTVIGDSSSYRFIYTPPYLWDYNDTVTVTISGADSPPLVDGNPFFCGPAQVNHFVGDIPFQVLNQTDFGASLVALGDTSPPYIAAASPPGGSSDNSVFTTVTITIADDLTGVELSSIYVAINSTSIIAEGLPTSEEAVIHGTPSAYVVSYTPTTAFLYGSIAIVYVTAQDRVGVSPNILATSYSFSFIDSGTLVIDGFLPPVGTTTNPEEIDIEVDVYDDSFGINQAQCFLVINGATVASVETPTVSGVHLSYHPPNDFNYGAPIRVTVHGTNGNYAAPVVRESFYTLYYGQRILYSNHGPYDHGSSVDVFVRARNTELLYKDLSTGYFFTAYTQPQGDLGAYIFAENPTADLSASLTVLAPEHRYGQTVTVEFSIEDLDGHLLGPYNFVYTIESRPE